jgi:hypothetical protein
MKQKHLILVFLVLLGVFLANYYFNKDKDETTMIADLALIDTAEVSAMIFYPKESDFQEMKLEKAGDKWRLKYGNKDVAASSTAVQSILTQLNFLKPKRLAAKSVNSWEKYEVTDSLGTRVKIQENGEQVADLMIGKFIYNQQTGAGTSFVRRYEEDEIYAIDGYLNMAFNRKAEAFRDNQLVYTDAASWNKLTFNYPADSSFVLMKQDGYWFANGQPTDSMAVASYVSSMSRLGTTVFLDDADISATAPEFNITIEGDAMMPIELYSYNLGPARSSVMTSSMNEDGLFDGTASDLSTRTFVGINKFLLK